MGEKLYCYVDETGQDTEGNIFIITVVVPKDRDAILHYIESVEATSGKGKVKWGRANPEKRFHYLQTIFNQNKFSLGIYYSVYKNTKEYKTSTIITIVKALQAIKHYKQHKFVICVDGLGEKDQRYFGAQIHKLGIPSRRVRGIKKDESNALIRLADSICGFVRDVLEEKKTEKELKAIYRKALRESRLKEV
jgi:hypothetical protein